MENNEYIIINTFCDSEEIANKIVNILLEKKLVAGRTKKKLFNEIETEIKKIHNYKTAEISCIEIKDGNKDFLDWIENNTK